MTPGSQSNSPFTPQTPGASLDISGQSDWYSPDIEVTIKDTHEDPGLQGQSGVIRGVTPGIQCFQMHKNPPKISTLHRTGFHDFFQESFTSNSISVSVKV